jgi:hypothetical protein
MRHSSSVQIRGREISNFGGNFARGCPTRFAYWNAFPRHLELVPSCTSSRRMVSRSFLGARLGSPSFLGLASNISRNYCVNPRIQITAGRRPERAAPAWRPPSQNADDTLPTDLPTNGLSKPWFRGRPCGQAGEGGTETEGSKRAQILGPPPMRSWVVSSVTRPVARKGAPCLRSIAVRAG